MPNPRGQQRDKPFRDALRMEIAAAQNDDDPKSLRRIARGLLELAAERDVRAIQEIADRMDGKVAQAIVGDDDYPPVAPAMSDTDICRRLAFLLTKPTEG